ncbi:DNA-binding response OmpR family regulator [Malaciobacter marinus]|jgi:DNA-binding response OmpR family regulator|uniref:DNA-binding response OmpR family regulator n=1 Tax=Malaciobacter marinus TaxID=505249 RepID=A0AB36ZXI1_9BACT|nr:response regulator transcription factor [Malaciobacter marinus]PPK60696.1 DNA-binding response OmpR family regulator [Malaciobacter marinus]SKB53571.1 DNA-binding response regulator, OmpR family, contains REC and winged-helix (wHTH) domain [Malaciobacter marinus]
MKILIIEDDKDIANFLKRGFEELHYTIEISNDGEEGEYLSIINKYDVIILDWMLPKKNGIEILNNLRQKNIFTPILMLTAKDAVEDKITGLKTGCDDYLSKPFSFEELEARVTSLYRRSSQMSNIMEFSNLKVNLDTKEVLKDNSIINLSIREYELLLLLIKNKNSYISKDTIEEMLYSNEEFLNSNVIQVTIYNLRKKVGKELIKNFRGIGYKIEI